ncbi:hypothetical protein HRU87_02590 [Aquiluna borgnonia]|uniref:Histidine kinase/HSP90-like ATPase domain-containing protein n=1 Tax=Aquiluna borgnonia TaxID=2499157 RepID=A0A7D4PYK8_9MICO|nr:ATP-binding protein [Aquiluna borgnonia]QKJ25105.1 hypothetical protein HRU87_02590 [Aquiluna borgnonia]
MRFNFTALANQIGGPDLLKPISLLPAVPFVILTSVLSIAFRQDDSVTGFQTIRDKWPELIFANLASIAVCFIAVFAINQGFRNRHQEAIWPMWIVLPLSFLLGALKGLTTAIFCFVLDVEKDLWVAVGSRWLSTGLLGLFLIPMVAVMTYQASQFLRQRELLVAKRALEQMSTENLVESKLASELSLIIAKTSNRLREVEAMAEASPKDAEKLFREELDVIIRDEIRPLSHKIWREQDNTVPTLSWRELLSQATGSTIQRPLLLGAWLFVGTYGGHAAMLGTTEAFTRVLLFSVVITGTLVLSRLLEKTLNVASRLGFFSSITIAVLFGVSITNTALGPIPGSSVSIEVIIFLIHLLQSGFILNLIHTFGEKRKQLRELKLSPSEAKSVATDVEKFILRLRSREFAQLLHSEIQNKLLNSILSSQRSSEINFDVRKESEKLRTLLSSFTDRKADSVAQLGTAIKKLVADWEGFLDIELEISPEAERISLDRIKGVSDLVSEAITNSVRHGSATQMQIKIDTREDVLTLRISDDGVGLRSSRVGLGTMLLAAVTENRYTIENAKGNGVEIRANLKISELKTQPD